MGNPSIAHLKVSLQQLKMSSVILTSRPLRSISCAQLHKVIIPPTNMCTLLGKQHKARDMWKKL